MSAIVAKLTSETPLTTTSPAAEGLDPGNVIRGPFEGVEKRLIIQFETDFLASSRSLADGNLRSLPHETWTAVLRHASCQILNRIELNLPPEESRGGCTAYLLSESSLFVFESKIILKTCGTTTPLLVVPILLQLLSSNKLGFFTPFDALFATKKLCSPSGSVDKETLEASFDELSTRPPTSDYSASSSGETSPNKIISFHCLSAASSPSTAMDSEACESSDVSEGEIEGVRLAGGQRVATASQVVSYLFFTHMNYCFPELQRFPHRSFNDEVAFLDNIFVEQNSIQPGQADFFTLKSSPDREFFCYAWRRHQGSNGDSINQENLSIEAESQGFRSCSSSWAKASRSCNKINITELIMLDIEETCVTTVAGRGQDSNKRSGTHLKPFMGGSKSLLHDYVSRLAKLGGDRPGAELDEYWFEPCGYSCNSLIPCESVDDGASLGYFTCHISPEPESSYASWEVSLLPENLNEASLNKDICRRLSSSYTSALCFQDVISAFKPRSAHVIEICLDLTACNCCQGSRSGGSDFSLASERFGMDNRCDESMEEDISYEEHDCSVKAGMPYRRIRGLRREGAWFSVGHTEYRAIVA